MKKLILFLTALLYSATGFSQAQNWEWAAGAADSITYDRQDPRGSKICSDPFGNIFVGGIFYGSTMTFGSTILTGTNLYHDFFLTKYDSNGTIIWTKSFGGNTYAQLNALCSDSNGNLIITGTYSGVLDLGGDTLTGSQSLFIAKFDPSGNTLWAKSYGNGIATGSNITVDQANNIYTTGSFRPTINFDGIILNAPVYNSMFIVKHDSSGNTLWAQTQSGGTAEGQGISHDGLGNIYYTGSFGNSMVSFGSFTLIPQNPYDMYIVKSDSLGNILWAKKKTKIANDNEGYRIATDSSGNSYVTGQFFNDSLWFDGTLLINKGSANDDFFLIKFDPSGNMLWAKSEGGSNYDFANDIKTDKYGNVYVTGSFQSPSISFGLNTMSSFGTNLFIVKYNPAGNVLWAKSSSGTGNNNFSSGICLDPAENIYIEGGFSNSSISFGSTTLNCPRNAFDFFIAKLSQCVLTGTTISNVSCNAISLNGETFYQTGTFTQTLSGQGGCDSVLHLDFTISSDDTILTVFSCGPYVLNGVPYNNSGLFHQNYTGYTGCDSTYTLNLTIDRPDLNVTQSALWLSSAQNGGSFQWVDCADGFTPIINETNQVFYPSGDGIYAGIITTPAGCSDTTDCYVFTNLSITENPFENSVNVYPNPFAGVTTISFAHEQRNVTIRIIGLLGMEIKRIKFSGTTFQFEKGELSCGVYYLQITDEENHTVTKKIIIQ